MIFIWFRPWRSRSGGKVILVEDWAEIRWLHQAEQMQIRAFTRHLGAVQPESRGNSAVTEKSSRPISSAKLPARQLDIPPD
jgi:hypothetical protein